MAGPKADPGIFRCPCGKEGAKASIIAHQRFSIRSGKHPECVGEIKKVSETGAPPAKTRNRKSPFRQIGDWLTGADVQVQRGAPSMVLTAAPALPAAGETGPRPQESEQPSQESQESRASSNGNGHAPPPQAPPEEAMAEPPEAPMPVTKATLQKVQVSVTPVLLTLWDALREQEGLEEPLDVWIERSTLLFWAGFGYEVVVQVSAPGGKSKKVAEAMS